MTPNVGQELQKTWEKPYKKKKRRPILESLTQRNRPSRQDQEKKETKKSQQPESRGNFLASDPAKGPPTKKNQREVRGRRKKRRSSA